MTPLEIEIVLHYHSRANDYRDGDHSVPAVSDAIAHFCGAFELLEETPLGMGAKYRLTDRGRVYAEALVKLPLPALRWMYPPSAET